MSRRRQFIAILALSALAVVLWPSCASPARQRVLAALFDDPPGAEEEEAEQPAAPVTAPETPATREVTRVEWAGSWHGPHAAGLCQACHSGAKENPAGGGELARLRRGREQLCVGCHERRALLASLGAEDADVLHGPVASGHCTACHLPHRSREPALLRVTEERLCLTCHRGEDLGESHPELDGIDCMACHDPHAPGSSEGVTS